MWLSNTLSTFALLAPLLAATASPTGIEERQIEKRCEYPCGYNNWLCCGPSQTCSVNSNNEAVCVDGGGGSSGHWEYITKTYTTTETDIFTITSVWSSFVTGPTPSSSCERSLGLTPCGSDCCDPASVCINNQCVLGSSSIGVTVTTPTETNSQTPLPPVRGTSNGFSTVTETAMPTTTQGFIAPVGSNGATIIGAHAFSSTELSGGQVAGIVVGVIAGAALLFFLCAYLCCRGFIDDLFALLGCGHRRRRAPAAYGDRYTRRPNGNRPHGRTWFGAPPPNSGGREEEDSGLGFWTKAAIIAGAIALCLGLRRRRDHEEKSEYSDLSSSYYYYSDRNTSQGDSSSDRRTRETRDSRRSISYR